MGVGAQIACVPRRFALIMVAREWLASPWLGSFGVMLGSFGAVRQTPLFRWGPSPLSYRRLCPGGVLRRRPHLAPREVIVFHVSLGSLEHDWEHSVETAWKPLWVGHGNLMETTWKPRGNSVETTCIFICYDFEPKRNSCRTGANQDPCRYPCQNHWALGPGFMASISRIPEARRFRRCPVDDKGQPTTTTTVTTTDRRRRRSTTTAG